MNTNANTTPAKMRPVTLASMIADRALHDGPTDLTIACRDGRRFEIHKSVVCPQSHVLAAMCQIGMTEQHTGVIEHKVFESDTVELMLRHAYTGAYVTTKRPVPLSLLERESELDDMEQETRKAGKEEVAKEKAVGKSGNESGNENDLSEDTESNRLDAVSAAAAITLADEDAVARLVGNLPHALLLSTQSLAPSQKEETTRKLQQSVSIRAFNARIPLRDQWLSITDQLVTHARVYGLADYYEMKKLREYSCKSFSDIVNQRRVDLRPEHTLRSFIDVVREIGARTDNSTDPCGLRMSFLKLVVEHATDLCTNRHFIKDLGDSGLSELAADMLHEVAQSLSRDRHYHIDRRKSLMTLHTRMTEKEEFWEDCAPGWQRR